MDPVSPLPAIICVLVAMATAALLVRQFGAPPDQGRFASIDGLRGYLAFFVFLHHSCTWYFFLRSGQWKVPPSNLYTYFGLGSVAFFFMITGFLFFSKLLEGRTRKIDWGRLFVSRVMRLTPLYVFAMLLLFLIVAYLSGFSLQEPVSKLTRNMISWLGFTIPGAPDLNGVPRTAKIIAGVTWSLPYEWLFYCSLPLLALTVRVIPPWPYILFGVISVCGLFMLSPEFHHLILLSFLGGIAASFLARWDLFCGLAIMKGAPFVVLGCVAIAIANYPSPFGYVPVFLLSVAFAIIACGNSLFGILVSPISRMLGEMAYSIYLLHGLVLFVTFVMIIGLPELRGLSPVTHWLLVSALTPVLIVASFMSFRFIESPAMRSTAALTDWLRRKGIMPG